jgi:hypothetical protein
LEAILSPKTAPKWILTSPGPKKVAAFCMLVQSTYCGISWIKKMWQIPEDLRIVTLFSDSQYSTVTVGTQSISCMIRVSFLCSVTNNRHLKQKSLNFFGYSYTKTYKLCKYERKR